MVIREMAHEVWPLNCTQAHLDIHSERLLVVVSILHPSTLLVWTLMREMSSVYGDIEQQSVFIACVWYLTVSFGVVLTHIFSVQHSLQT